MAHRNRPDDPIPLGRRCRASLDREDCFIVRPRARLALTPVKVSAQSRRVPPLGCDGASYRASRGVHVLQHHHRSATNAGRKVDSLLALERTGTLAT
jgi:hypothetical protein